MNRLCLASLFCLLFCSSGFPQGFGTIQCDSGMDRVPAWTGVELMRSVVDSLPCGQKVTLLSLEDGFWKVNTGQKVSFVEAKYVRKGSAQPSPSSVVAQPTGTNEPIPAATGPQHEKKLTNEDVIEMSALHLSDEVIIDKINSTEAKDFDTSVDGLKLLKSKNISDAVIRAMINGKPQSAATGSSNVALGNNHPSNAKVVAAPSEGLTQEDKQFSVQPLVQPTCGEEDCLTDEQVTAAIERALHGKRHDIGLALNDIQTAFFSGLGNRTSGTSGFTIYMFTPTSWIEFQAVRARREMMPFGLNDVTSDMRMPYLHVLALPSTADYITGVGLSMASSVRRVVMSNTERTETIQPLDLSHGTVQSNSAFRSVDYVSAGAVFRMQDVQRLRGMDKNREFFIVVVGDNQNKFFKIKERFFKQLFGDEY